MKVRDHTIPRLYSTSGKLSDAGIGLCDAVAVSRMLPGFEVLAMDDAVGGVDDSINIHGFSGPNILGVVSKATNK